MMNKANLFMVFTLWLAEPWRQVTPNKIECPRLQCMGIGEDEYHPDTNICFEHDGEVPTKKLIGQNCDYHQARTLEFNERVICDFDLLTQTFAWVEEDKQHLSGASKYKPLKQETDAKSSSSKDDQGLNYLTQDMSPMKNKKTTALCRTYSAINNNKMAGRNCSQHDECITMKCDKDRGKCEGRLDTHTCFSHADCDAAFFCNKDKKYPYVSTCKNLKTSYATCTESTECLHTLYCWYADVKESPINKDGKDNKQCLPMYSQEQGKSFGWNSANFDDKLAGKIPWEYEDFEINGKYCNTGLAFLFLSAEDKEKNEGPKYQSVCAKVDKIMQGDRELTSPYECDPSDNNSPCEIFPNNIVDVNKGKQVTKSFKVPCKCALDGKKGYCSKIIGTEEYKTGALSQYLQREKSRCHTLDRDNYVSWLDCSTESNMDNIEGAINWSFNLTHWPYIHDQEVKKCIQTLSKKSWQNIQPLKSAYLELKMTTIAITALVSSTLVFIIQN